MTTSQRCALFTVSVIVIALAAFPLPPWRFFLLMGALSVMAWSVPRGVSR